MNAFAARPGAVTDGDGIAHFGDPMREQRRLAGGTAVAPLGDRAVIELAGEDRLTWLDSITSQAVATLRPGASTELLVLDPQGRVEHAAGIVDDGASSWLITDAADQAPLAAWLRRMVFRARVSIAERSDLHPIGFFAGGPAEAAVVASAISPAGVAVIWTDPWPVVQPGGHQYSDAADHPGASFHWRVGLLEGDALAQLVATDAAGLLAAEALRVAAWRPRWAAEVDERSLPHETDWLRSAVHLAKGCYRGQETVAKVHNLGHPPRRLALLHLDGTAETLPERGAAVVAGDAEVGHVTSAARHYEDGPIALAVLSRRAPDGNLVVHSGDAHIAAAQEIIVPADAGATADVPRLTRLSRRPLASDPAD